MLVTFGWLCFTLDNLTSDVVVNICERVLISDAGLFVICDVMIDMWFWNRLRKADFTGSGAQDYLGGTAITAKI